MKTKSHTYKDFVREVNRTVESNLGCGTLDLPDSITLIDYWHSDCEKFDQDFWGAVDAAYEDLSNNCGVTPWATY